MKLVRILILEDDLETLSVLLKGLCELEENWSAKGRNKDIAVTVFSEYTQVENYLNKVSNPNFDMILLDRDCKLGGSFHALNMAKFSTEKIISISSIPQYNEDVQKLGVIHVVHKDYKNLEKFSGKVMALVAKEATF